MVRYRHKLNSTRYPAPQKKAESHRITSVSSIPTGAYTRTHTVELYTTRAIIIPNTYQHYMCISHECVACWWENSYNYAPQYSLTKGLLCLVYWLYEFSLKTFDAVYECFPQVKHADDNESSSTGGYVCIWSSRRACGCIYIHDNKTREVNNVKRVALGFQPCCWDLEKAISYRAGYIYCVVHEIVGSATHKRRIMCVHGGMMFYLPIRIRGLFGTYGLCMFGYMTRGLISWWLYFEYLHCYTHAEE